ncbi:hypothetical protein L1049_016885 [Liquidambar formosana]|uniref:Uncharacterized protein n=1 Tax=Liquidambar formosana TaxID=63359 RepID=A0AAP0X738_LIQFO
MGVLRRRPHRLSTCNRLRFSLNRRRLSPQSHRTRYKREREQEKGKWVRFRGASPDSEENRRAGIVAAHVQIQVWKVQSL